MDKKRDRNPMKQGHQKEEVKLEKHLIRQIQNLQIKISKSSVDLT